MKFYSSLDFDQAYQSHDYFLTSQIGLFQLSVKLYAGIFKWAQVQIVHKRQLFTLSESPLEARYSKVDDRRFESLHKIDIP